MEVETQAEPKSQWSLGDTDVSGDRSVAAATTIQGGECQRTEAEPVGQRTKTELEGSWIDPKKWRDEAHLKT